MRYLQSAGRAPAAAGCADLVHGTARQRTRGTGQQGALQYMQ
jgi:hypothetical protein